MIASNKPCIDFGSLSIRHPFFKKINVQLR